MKALSHRQAHTQLVAIIGNMQEASIEQLAMLHNYCNSPIGRVWVAKAAKVVGVDGKSLVKEIRTQSK